MDLLRILSLNVSETKEAYDYLGIIKGRDPSEHAELFEILQRGRFVTENRYLALIVVCIYLPTVFGIKSYMAKRKAFNLKAELFLWNFALGMFSVFAFTQTVPALGRVIWYSGFRSSICELSGYRDLSIAVWCFMFIYSKYVELADTIFIVLRKKPLVFLQWYHHVVTLLHCWLVGPLIEPLGLFFAVMNYGVHSMMYPYFALKAWGFNTPRWVPNVVTTFQLMQMCMGFFINFYTLYLIRCGIPCRRFPLSIYSSFVIYGSFLFLFGKLFVDVVIKSRKNRPKSE